MLILATAFFITVAEANPPAAKFNRSYPVRGMTMNNVRLIFGSPEKILPPDPRTAGGPLRPPINRWIYPHFIVYFERNRVINTVQTHPFNGVHVYSPPSSGAGTS